VMDAWRTSCTRLPVWEDAYDNGFVVETRAAGPESLVELTPLGRSFLEASRRIRT
jgi:D-3-phosphoglycerate dehydrogenase